MKHNISIKELHEIADKGSLQITLSQDVNTTGIIKVAFNHNDVHYEAQYDDTNRGVYGFSIESPEQLFFPDWEN